MEGEAALPQRSKRKRVRNDPPKEPRVNRSGPDPEDLAEGWADELGSGPGPKPMRSRHGRKVCFAVWRETVAMYEVTVSKGSVAMTHGDMWKSKLWLYPEEAVYLVERGQLVVFRESQEPTAPHDGQGEIPLESILPMSLLYRNMLQSGIPYPIYCAYRKMRKHTYVVRRSAAAKLRFEGSRIRDLPYAAAVTVGCLPCYDCYETDGKPFRKKHAGTPTFSLMVAGMEGGLELSPSLFEGPDYTSPLKVAAVEGDGAVCVFGISKTQAPNLLKLKADSEG
ncbi:unnamed protein product [Chrysoparadoxa australica]